MYFICVLFIFNLIGNLRARQPDIDINRVKLVPKSRSNIDSKAINTHNHRSLDLIQLSRNHDYDDRGRGVHEWHPQMHHLHSSPSYKEPKTLKIHESPEDPRLFYQSDVYLKKISQKNINNEVSYIYPGREVIRASENSIKRTPIRSQRMKANLITKDHICVRCPNDRTLIARPGSNRVILQHPRLQSCKPGKRVPKNAQFVRMYGPEFGSLLTEGSHMLVGRITHLEKPLQICKMQIYVVSQSCPAPENLILHCEKGNKVCNFTCRYPDHLLYGAKSLTCGTNMKWNGTLPICKAQISCNPPTPPDHGRISCKGGTSLNGSRLLDGSLCRVRCRLGRRWTPKITSICRRGVWTRDLTCQPRKH
ncbi:uncharacterized protein LOC131841694 [Achroia grisella]|uniref:uncharacterized protein LOC131841694 n=1 Tax=Achroia grisella TaxID=688607 RepID=UPI0027D303F8|nr:uncharacterized protein LOC131841694 [Achroia grisella]